MTALILGQYWVAAIVVLMLSGGKALESYATERANSVLSALAKRMPQTAHRVGEVVADVSIDSIAVDDHMIVYPHEICPVDGVVVSGQGSMDESYLTGEPFQIAKAPGTFVLSGSINGDAALTIRATKVAIDSRYAKIVEVLHASEENRPQIQRLGDRLGSWYTPIAIAIALASWLLSGDSSRFLAVLVIATPCPLLISIPVAIIGAISVGARFGIIIKDPSILGENGDLSCAHCGQDRHSDLRQAEFDQRRLPWRHDSGNSAAIRRQPGAILEASARERGAGGG